MWARERKHTRARAEEQQRHKSAVPTAARSARVAFHVAYRRAPVLPLPAVSPPPVEDATPRMTRRRRRRRRERRRRADQAPGLYKQGNQEAVCFPHPLLATTTGRLRTLGPLTTRPHRVPEREPPQPVGRRSDSDSEGDWNIRERFARCTHRLCSCAAWQVSGSAVAVALQVERDKESCG